MRPDGLATFRLYFRPKIKGSLGGPCKQRRGIERIAVGGGMPGGPRRQLRFFDEDQVAPTRAG